MKAIVYNSLRWERALVAIAYALLVVAFVIGQIAARTDYDALLKQEMPKLKLTRSQENKVPPIVYRVEASGDASSDVVVMAEGTGYGGPLVVGIRAERTETGARVNEILVLGHKETPAFMARIENRNFFRQFAGKDVSDNFIVGDDIDAVSGASVSSIGFTAAVRQAVHLGAVQHLGLARTWQETGWNLGFNEAFLVALFALAFFANYFRGKLSKYVRWVVMAGALIFVGFHSNASVSLGNLAGIVMGYIPPPKQHPLWWIMMIGVFGSVLLLGRNIYCQHICPFNVVTHLLQKVSGVRLKIRPNVQRKARALIYSLSWVALMLIFLSAHPALGSYEPFALMFSLEGLGIQWYILPAALIGSFFVPSFWCRLFCPVGLYLNEMVRLRRSVRDRLWGKAPGRKALAERNSPQEPQE